MALVALLSVGYFWSVGALVAPITDRSGEIDLVSLTNHVLLLEQSYSDLSTKYETRVSDLETTVQTLASELKSANAQLQSNSNQLSNLTASIAKMKTAVSFEMVLTAGLFTVLDHEVLKFDKVLINEGNAYSNVSGIFRAPIAGTYLFWAHILNADSIQNLDIHIKKNGDILVRGESPAHFLWGKASVTALTHLDERDEIWFTKDAASDKIYGHNISSYGGVLITAD